MQPTFPPDHHFYRRRRPAPSPGSRDEWGNDATAPDRALGYFARQRVPAFDPSDPRCGH